ncbi:hypothetical protein [Mucilaginibacter ginsenosidivorax]|uniref:Uncharacterized protein n=1 Tax=Mucilaginibacter ginsenosidivorax TaxID=862126 RepID=A0A5B8VV38_9SPHI|nr:hypothetical protein [Mucilaginibacter ginsenosidivorax]QEC74636.1 hypothetical protein FSB76_01245 [Mucilaginibacter ginsenosidivorax]
MQVEIFNTNVEREKDAAAIIEHLLQHFPHYQINFDLEDCDRILRIAAKQHPINKQQVIQLLGVKGYACAHLI